MLLTYLNALKTQGNFTYDTISKLSQIPVGTVKNIFTGDTKNPGIETVSAIVTAMGGSLSAISTATKNEDVEANSVITLKESYEHRIKDMREHYESRIEELKTHAKTVEEHYESRLADKRDHIDTILLDKKWFRLGFCISIFIFAALCVAELLNPNLGWFRY